MHELEENISGQYHVFWETQADDAHKSNTGSPGTKDDSNLAP